MSFTCNVQQVNAGPNKNFKVNLGIKSVCCGILRSGWADGRACDMYGYVWYICMESVCANCAFIHTVRLNQIPIAHTKKFFKWKCYTNNKNVCWCVNSASRPICVLFVVYVIPSTSKRTEYRTQNIILQSVFCL